jgi:molybdopterin molybdotransferase
MARVSDDQPREETVQTNSEFGNGPTLMPVDEALKRLLAQALSPPPGELVDTDRALGRVLAETLLSGVDVPPDDSSAMDGYAVATRDLRMPAMPLPVLQRIAAGARPHPMLAGTAARIFTGAPIPPGADAVILQEDCRIDAHGQLVVCAPARPGDHIRLAGSDIASGTAVLARGTRLRPQDLGLAASVGLARVPVYRRLRVGLISTGNELTAPGEFLSSGHIYNANRFTLAGMLQAIGCSPLDYGSVRDDPEATRRALARAAEEMDVVISSGGVSAGEEDHVRSAVAAIGRVDLWRIAVKPGKPLTFGFIGATPILGLPGNPVSAFVTFCLFARPFLLRSQGATDVAPPSVHGIAEFDREQAGTRREYLRARLRSVEHDDRITLYPNQSSGALISAAWADGLVELPEGEVVRRGQRVRFIPFAGLIT